MTEQITLPNVDWDEDATLKSEGGRRLQRWGSVRLAKRMLWGIGNSAVYELILTGEIKAIKKGRARNAHWRVDLMSVWAYKQDVERRNREELGV